MTNNNLPEEVLPMIFNFGDDKKEANVYQHVCRSWYRPAHITFLQNIVLCGIDKIDQFLRSIDCNPDPLYLKAVKKITITQVDRTVNYFTPKTLFKQASIKKLFFQFLNLENVLIEESFKLLQIFNDKLCQEFLYNCPRLVTFDIGYTDRETLYLDVLQKARLLLTAIDMRALVRSANMLDVISSIPRLNYIQGDFVHMDSFTKLLPIVETVPHLKRVCFENRSRDVEGFAENYILSKPEEEKDQVLEKLSQVDSLNWSTGRFTSDPLNSLEFIPKYLTGLTQLELRVLSYKPWDDPQQSQLYSIALDLIRSKHNSKLDLLVSDDYTYRYLEFIATQTKPRTLQLSLAEHHQPVLTMRIESDNQESLNILASYETPPWLFSTTTPLVSIDEFALKIKKRHHNSHTYVEDYSRIFGGLPTLKKATLDVPAKLSKKRASTSRTPFPQPVDFTLQEIPDNYMDQQALCLELESLTLQATPNGEIQPILKTCPYMFPNLKNLDIYYHCGVWEETIGTFHLVLGGFSLEKLALDMTPLKMKMKKEFNKDQFTKDDFFVVAVECLHGEETHLYKVSFDLSSATKIIGNDLKGFARNKDYLRVSIILPSLRQLVLVSYRYGTPKEEDEYYLDLGKYTTHIDIS